jgi:Na+/H+ antiporter NhaA
MTASPLRRTAPEAQRQTRPRNRALIGQVSGPLRAFLATEAGSAGLLLGATAVAVGWANSLWAGAYESLWSTELSVRLGSMQLAMDLRHWVNDGVMALFFFVIGLEVRRELSVGALRNSRSAVVPLLAGLGGMAIPAALFWSSTRATPPGQAGALSSGPTPPSCSAPWHS